MVNLPWQKYYPSAGLSLTEWEERGKRDDGVIDEETMKTEYPRHYDKIMADPELQKIYIRGGDHVPETKTTAVNRVQMNQSSRIN